jgi:hypothetical protein
MSFGDNKRIHPKGIIKSYAFMATRGRLNYSLVSEAWISKPVVSPTVR